MKLFKQLTVGKKLVFGFATMIAILGCIGVAGYQSTAKINRNLDEIFEVNLPSIDYLLQADRDLQQLLVAERSMIFANAKSDTFKELVKQYEENLKQSQERWEKYKALPASAEEKAIFPKYEKSRNEWQAISKKIVDGRVADTRKGRREALDLTLGQAREKFEQMRNYLDQLTGLNHKAAGEAHHAADEAFRNTITILITITGVGLALGLLLFGNRLPGAMRSVGRSIVEFKKGMKEVDDDSTDDGDPDQK